MKNDITDYQMSRDLARLMLMMRRFIKEEFSVTIHLDAPEAVDELLAFADRSHNDMLKEMAKELEDLVAPSDGEPSENKDQAASPPPSSYYRGAPIQQQQSAASPKTASTPAKRIYRGQVIG